MQKSEFKKSYQDSNSYTNIIQLGKVISVDDNFDSSRIKVRLKGLDDSIKDADLPWCTPLIPLFFFNLPQEGEAVKVLLSDTTKKQSKREWIGPIITQFQNLNQESYLSATSNRDYGLTQLSQGVSKIPDAIGLFPNKKAIAILGRDNVDVVLNPKSLMLRVGRHEMDNIVKRNLKNPAYINLRMYNNNSTSVINVVADEINLISHKGTPQFSTDIDDEALEAIKKDGYFMVKGDILKDFLEFIKDFAVNHIHPPELPPNPGIGKVPEISQFDLNSMLSKHIRIN